MQKNILEGIGNTPMFDFSAYADQLGLKANLFAKLEKYNPQGSVKDRVAKYMIDDAIQNGTLVSGGTIIEPTSGNTGIGLAYVGKQMGFKVILTMPESMSMERIKYMEALGAEIYLTDKTQGMKGAIAKSIELQASMPNSIILDQFANKSNPKAHFETTAPEIFAEMDKKIDIFVAGIGTGGTVTGVGKFLKQHLPHVQIVGVEPAESPFLTAGRAGAHKIQGIGAGFEPKALDRHVLNSVMTVSGDDAFRGVHKLRETTSMLVGISSGANFIAALRLARKEENAGKNIVTLFPDGGEKYFSVENYL